MVSNDALWQAMGPSDFHDRRAPGRLSGGRFTHKSPHVRGAVWARLDSYQGPPRCERGALPLSHAPGGTRFIPDSECRVNGGGARMLDAGWAMLDTGCSI